MGPIAGSDGSEPAARFFRIGVRLRRITCYACFRMRFRHADPWALVLAALLDLGGCDAFKSTEDPPPGPAANPEAAPPPDAKGPPPAAELSATPTEPEPPLPLEKNPRKLALMAKGGTNMGFKIGALSPLFALEGTVAVPPWSPAGTGSIESVRDDDLHSAWSCSPKDEARCGLGIHFPRKAKVAAVRFATGKGPRPHVIRIHTEEGYADANLIDAGSLHYALLGSPVATRNLMLEILDVFAPKGQPVEITEVEIYGDEGEPRPALQVDPSATYVAYGAPPWSVRGDSYTLAQGTIVALSEDGPARALLPGSALLGHTGDRFLLLEQVERGACSEAYGTYFLLDRETRMLAPLGELGGPGGDVFRRANGLGIALGYTDEFTTTLNGVVWEDGRYERKRTPVRADKRGDDTFGEWGMEPTPIPRGGMPLPKPPQGCATADPAIVAKTLALDAKSSAQPTTWVTCSVGGSQLFATDHGPCGTRFELHLVDASGKVVAQHRGQERLADVRLTRLSETWLLAEVSAGEATSTVFDVRPDRVVSLGPHTSLATRPPRACRTQCQANFPNPHAPKWQ